MVEEKVWFCDFIFISLSLSWFVFNLAWFLHLPNYSDDNKDKALPGKVWWHLLHFEGNRRANEPTNQPFIPSFTHDDVAFWNISNNLKKKYVFVWLLLLWIFKALETFCYLIKNLVPRNPREKRSELRYFHLAFCVSICLVLMVFGLKRNMLVLAKLCYLKVLSKLMMLSEMSAKVIQANKLHLLKKVGWVGWLAVCLVGWHYRKLPTTTLATITP